MILTDQGYTEEALRDYEQAIKARAPFIDAWINRSDLLRRLHRYEEALHSSERTIACDPRHPQAHNCYGATLADMGRYEEAITSFDRAIELHPSLAEAVWNKGLIQLARGDFREG